MKFLILMIIVLTLALSGCSQSSSAEVLILTLPLAPQATTPRQSGSMLDYSVPGICSEVASFYETQLPLAGWMLLSSTGTGTSWMTMKFEKERDTAEIHLSSSPVGPINCSVKVFYHKFSSLDTGIPQRVATIIIILMFQGLFAFAGGLAAKGKGRHPAIGWLLGFFLGFLGDFFILTWEPRRDLSGRMIGWDEYKHMSIEQKEAVLQKPSASFPDIKRRRLLVLILVVILVVVAVLQILRNLGIL